MKKNQKRNLSSDLLIVITHWFHTAFARFPEGLWSCEEKGARKWVTSCFTHFAIEQKRTTEKKKPREQKAIDCGQHNTRDMETTESSSRNEKKKPREEYNDNRSLLIVFLVSHGMCSLNKMESRESRGPGIGEQKKWNKLFWDPWCLLYNFLRLLVSTEDFLISWKVSSLHARTSRGIRSQTSFLQLF